MTQRSSLHTFILATQLLYCAPGVQGCSFHRTMLVSSLPKRSIQCSRPSSSTQVSRIGYVPTRVPGATRRLTVHLPKATIHRRFVARMVEWCPPVERNKHHAAIIHGQTTNKAETSHSKCQLYYLAAPADPACRFKLPTGLGRDAGGDDQRGVRHLKRYCTLAPTLPFADC